MKCAYLIGIVNTLNELGVRITGAKAFGDRLGIMIDGRTTLAQAGELRDRGLTLETYAGVTYVMIGDGDDDKA
jgi:hypothetical protein